MRLCGWGFALLAVALVGGVARAQGQEAQVMAADAHPSFEVATIKPSDPEDHSAGFHEMGRQLFIENMTLESMIAAGYGVHPKQIVEAPDWVAKEYWDVRGVPDVAGMPSWPQYREMVQKLLRERFGLKFHREKRELSIYAITVAKGGAKLTASKGDMNGMLDQTGNGSSTGQQWRYTNNSIADFAEGMKEFLDRPVVDETGLKGKVRFSFGMDDGSECGERSEGASGIVYRGAGAVGVED